MEMRLSLWPKRVAKAIPPTLGNLANTLFPRPCWLCSAPAEDFFCDHCEACLPLNHHYRCQQCDLPLLVEASHCAECLESPPSFQRAICAFRYDFPLDSLMRQLKKERKHRIAAVLGHYLTLRLQGQIVEPPDILCPFPIHWSRRLSRGFNQAELIAESVSKNLAIPMLRALKKTHATRAQKALSRKKRLRNLTNSLEVSRDVKGKYVVLIDDVITTGASVESASRKLLDAGASRVDVWAIARTPKS